MLASAAHVATSSCLEAFGALRGHLQAAKPGLSGQVSDADIEDEFGRFRLWAANIGALSRGHGSLDYRLRDAPVVLEGALKLLNELQQELHQMCLVLSGERLPYEAQISSRAAHVDDSETSSLSSDSESSSDSSSDSDDEKLAPSELRRRVSALSNINDNLYRLSRSIRAPASHSRSLKALSYKLIDKETGVDVVQQYVPVDLAFTKDLFSQLRRNAQDQCGNCPMLDDADVAMIKRLAQGITRRRQQFLYWKHHRKKLGFNAEREILKIPKPAPTVQLKGDETRESVAGPRASLPVVGKAQTESSRPKTTLTETTATLFIGPTTVPDGNQSTTSYATTARGLDGSRIEFPKLPKGIKKGKDFECPYCLMICPPHYQMPRAWRAHLLRDLRPYMCTHKHCQQSDELFATKQEWLNHEHTHQKAWQCPEHASTHFSMLEDLKGHLLAETHESLQRMGLEDLLAICETVRPDSRTICPICFVDTGSPYGLENHLANHLERFAAFALPRDVDGDVDEESHNGSNMSEHAIARSDQSDVSELSQANDWHSERLEIMELARRVSEVFPINRSNDTIPAVKKLYDQMMRIAGLPTEVMDMLSFDLQFKTVFKTMPKKLSELTGFMVPYVAEDNSEDLTSELIFQMERLDRIIQEYAVDHALNSSHSRLGIDAALSDQSPEDGLKQSQTDREPAPSRDSSPDSVVNRTGPRLSAMDLNRSQAFDTAEEATSPIRDSSPDSIVNRTSSILSTMDLNRLQTFSLVEDDISPTQDSSLDGVANTTGPGPLTMDLGKLQGLMTEEEEFLINLREVQEPKLDWKTTVTKFNEHTGKNFRIPALQMRYARLKERLRDSVVGTEGPDDTLTNTSTLIHDILADKTESETFCRKQLTAYEVYTILPSDHDDDLEGSKNKNKDALPYGKDKDDAKPKKRERWAKVTINQELYPTEQIIKTIQKLDAGKYSITDKRAKLYPNQSMQVTRILDNKIMKERDGWFEWVLAQLHREESTDSETGRKKTTSMTIYLKRAPLPGIDVIQLYRERKELASTQAMQRQQARIFQHQQQAQAMQQQRQGSFNSQTSENIPKKNPSFLIANLTSLLTDAYRIQQRLRDFAAEDKATPNAIVRLNQIFPDICLGITRLIKTIREGVVDPYAVTSIEVTDTRCRRLFEHASSFLDKFKEGTRPSWGSRTEYRNDIEQLVASAQRALQEIEYILEVQAKVRVIRRGREQDEPTPLPSMGGTTLPTDNEGVSGELSSAGEHEQRPESPKYPQGNDDIHIPGQEDGSEVGYETSDKFVAGQGGYSVPTRQTRPRILDSNPQIRGRPVIIDERPLRGILKPGRGKFPEDPSPTREGIAPLGDEFHEGIYIRPSRVEGAPPPGARWTKINRLLVNPEALDEGQERYEARDDFVIVLRVLSKEEIQAYADATVRIRAARAREALNSEYERSHKRKLAKLRRAQQDRHDNRNEGTPHYTHWTKIDRKMVSPETLTQAGESFEETDDFVVVKRVLNQDEVKAYIDRTATIRTTGKVNTSYSDERLSRFAQDNVNYKSEELPRGRADEYVWDSSQIVPAAVVQEEVNTYNAAIKLIRPERPKGPDPLERTEPAAPNEDDLAGFYYGYMRPPNRELAPIQQTLRGGRTNGGVDIVDESRWTKINRRFVSPEALDRAHEKYFVWDHYVIVHRMLSREEVDAYTTESTSIRAARADRNEEDDDGHGRSSSPTRSPQPSPPERNDNEESEDDGEGGGVVLNPHTLPRGSMDTSPVRDRGSSPSLPSAKTDNKISPRKNNPSLPPHSPSAHFNKPLDRTASIAPALPLVFLCTFAFADCRLAFSTKHYWKHHVASNHMSFVYWECPLKPCPRPLFHTEGLLEQHLRWVHEPPDHEIAALVEKGEMPGRSLIEEIRCPVPGCTEGWKGVGKLAWDERMEHVAGHWAAVARREEAGGWTEEGGGLLEWAIREGAVVELEGGRLICQEALGLRQPEKSNDEKQPTYDDVSGSSASSIVPSHYYNDVLGPITFPEGEEYNSDEATRNDNDASGERPGGRDRSPFSGHRFEPNSHTRSSATTPTAHQSMNRSEGRPSVKFVTEHRGGIHHAPSNTDLQPTRTASRHISGYATSDSDDGPSTAAAGFAAAAVATASATAMLGRQRARRGMDPTAQETVQRDDVDAALEPSSSTSRWTAGLREAQKLSKRVSGIVRNPGSHSARDRTGPVTHEALRRDEKRLSAPLPALNSPSEPSPRSPGLSIFVTKEFSTFPDPDDGPRLRVGSPLPSTLEGGDESSTHAEMGAEDEEDETEATQLDDERFKRLKRVFSRRNWTEKGKGELKGKDKDKEDDGGGYGRSSMFRS